MELDVGSRIGDYEVISILGVGGMGKVYKVRNALSDRVEAMKVLLPNLAANPELADRFMREIKVQASLEHPNIAQLHTALRVDNQLLMLMEFVDGVSLEHKLKTEGPLPVPHAVDAVMQVLSALEFAHQRGVVHRDVKPANIMVTPTGAVKLMDFGIAKGSNDRQLTITGTTLGSLYYMSPEQIQGAQNLDARADLYSVGVTLYELVTGKRPFDGDSQYAIMAAHLEKAPVPPIEVDPRLPQMLNDIILLAVAKDPNARFQGAGAMRAALSSLIPAGAPPMAVAAAPAAAYAEPARMPTVPSYATYATPPPPPPQQPGGPPPSANFAQPGMPPAPAPPMPRQGGQRGLWMAAGALAAAVVVASVIYFAPWKALTASKQNDAATGAQQGQPLASPPSASPSQNPAQNPAQSAAQNPAAPSQPQPGAQPQGQQAAASAAGTPQPAGTLPASPAASAPPVSAQPPAGAPATQVAASHTRHTANQSALPQSPSVPPVAAAPPQPAQQQAAPPTVAAAPPQPTGPSRVEMQTFREHLAKLGVRANGIQSGLSSLERSQQSMGMNLSSKFTGPRDLMNSYMQGAQEAMNANDLASAKDLATKAERQIEILEKLLNR